jgi:F1F0 ATPase subunit 2
MNELPSSSGPVLALTCLVHLLLGFGLGLLYFEGLWRVVQRLSAHRSLAPTLILMAVRLAMVSGALFLASREGAVVLLLTALGLLGARVATVRRIGRIK